MQKLKDFLLTNNSPQQIIFKNTFWLYLSEIISKGLRFLTFIVITRFLGPEQYGIFEYLFSFIGMFFIFADFGVSNIFIRDFQQKEEKEKHVNLFYTLKIIFSFFFAILAIFGFLLIKKNIVNILIYLAFVSFYLLINIESFFESYFVAVQKTEKKFIFNFISSLILIIAIIFGLSIYKNISVVILAYLLSAFIGLFIAYFLLIKERKINFFWDKNLVKYYLYNGLPLVLLGILSYIFFSTDKIFLTHLRSMKEVGYYSLASRIISVLFFIPSLFNVALYPYLANRVIRDDNQREIIRLFKIIIFSSVLVAIFVAISILVLGNFFIPIFFGKEYLPSISILNTFIWIIIFVYPTIFLNYLLLSYRKQWLNFWAALIPAILNIILNLILIPVYGIFGAVFSSIIAQFINFIFVFTFSIYLFNKKLCYNL